MVLPPAVGQHEADHARLLLEQLESNFGCFVVGQFPIDLRSHCLPCKTEDVARLAQDLELTKGGCPRSRLGADRTNFFDHAKRIGTVNRFVGARRRTHVSVLLGEVLVENRHLLWSHELPSLVEVERQSRRGVVRLCLTHTREHLRRQTHSARVLNETLVLRRQRCKRLDLRTLSDLQVRETRSRTDDVALDVVGDDVAGNLLSDFLLETDCTFSVVLNNEFVIFAKRIKYARRVKLVVAKESPVDRRNAQRAFLNDGQELADTPHETALNEVKCLVASSLCDREKKVDTLRRLWAFHAAAVLAGQRGLDIAKAERRPVFVSTQSPAVGKRLEVPAVLRSACLLVAASVLDVLVLQGRGQHIDRDVLEGTNLLDLPSFFLQSLHLLRRQVDHRCREHIENRNLALLWRQERTLRDVATLQVLRNGAFIDVRDNCA